MAARLLDPKADFAWLSEIEQDLALVMEPRSKFDRVVLAERLVEAGLTLVSEAETFAKHPFRRAIGIRDGLMIALLAVCRFASRTSPRWSSVGPSRRNRETGG